MKKNKQTNPTYDYLVQRAVESPNKIILADPRHRLGSADLFFAVTALAARLQQSGVQKSSMVLMPGSRNLETALLIFSIQLLGAVCVLTDPKESPNNFLNRCQVTVPVDFEITVQESFLMIRAREQEYFERLDLWKSIMETEAGHFAPVKIKSDDLSFLIFTSGTTGKSKAVMLSQQNFIMNLLDTEALGDYRKDDLALGALPQHHVFGLALLFGTLVLGYGIFYPDSTDISSLLETIEKEKITRMNGVPSLYLAMAEHADLCDVSSLRSGLIAASPWTQAQFEFIEEKLGMTLISVYGMSECIGISCSSFKDSQSTRSGCVGPFYPLNTGKVLLESGSEAGMGEEGEIYINSPSRMLGYYPSRMQKKEFFATGDLGFLDETGALHISGRKKDLIIRNGNNLSPRLIEEALLSLPEIHDASVVGMADEKEGEVPWAAVILSSDSTENLHFKEAEILKQLNPLLPKNALPARIVSMPELPYNGNGKRDKKLLMEVLASWKA